jgi:hypothetical protein
MKCPHCDVEIRGIICMACGEETPPGSLYCYKCGAEIELDEEASFDMDSRILCSDESCTGVINEEGVCGVCGKPYPGGPPSGSKSGPAE